MRPPPPCPALSRYAYLEPALVVDGVKSGHCVHIAGAVLTACLVSATLRVIERVQQRLEEQRRAKERLERQKAGDDTQETLAEILSSAAKAASAVARKLL